MPGHWSKTALAVILFHSGLLAQPVVPVQSFAIPANNQSYADVADLVVVAPLIVDAQIRKTTKIPVEQAFGVPASVQRLLVEADVLALLRGNDGIAGTVRFTLDVPKDAKGKVPNLKKQRFFLLGSKAAGLPGTIRLARPDAMIAWSAVNDAMLRAITKEAVLIGAPQPVIAVTSAFHSPGTIIGEGESQIFIEAKADQIYALSVLSRPGMAKSWSVSTGEVIDTSANAPPKNTLLWYRLACGLPRELDAGLVETTEPENVERAQADYRFVVQSLGQCDRTRKIR